MKHKTLAVQEYALPISVKEEHDGGYVALCPIWSDCYAQGDTIEEAIGEITYVASSLIELYKEENLPIPLKLKKTSNNQGSTLSLNFPLIVSAS